MTRPDPTTPAAPVLIAAMAVAVLAGAPLVYLLWDAVNALLMGDIGAIDPLATLVAASVFGVLLWVLARSVMWAMGEPDTRIESRLTDAADPGADADAAEPGGTRPSPSNQEAP